MQCCADQLIDRPQRWDEPFGPAMTEADVDRLLQIEPFRGMDPGRFAGAITLRGVLKNDSRIVRYQPGDLIVREGDYGHSAFLILRGSVRVALEGLASELVGHQPRQRGGWLKALAQLWKQPKFPEVRTAAGLARHAEKLGGAGQRTEAGETRIFLQDVPRVLSGTPTAVMGPGEFFGELAALTRGQRSATVFADDDAELLEIRWQGLREFMRRDSAVRDYIHQRYRENSLLVHLRETPWLAELPAEQLQVVVKEARFEWFGEFEWQTDFTRVKHQDASRRIESEPVIAEEDQPPAGAILLRSGFARLSRRRGEGHQTIAYLGKGRVFGLAESVHNVLRPEPALLENSLRAVGYVDIIRLTNETLQTHVVPYLPQATLDALLSEVKPRRVIPIEQEKTSAAEAALKSLSLLEFLVEGRYINGSQTMLIDLDRCTRCDDCVRACAATHDNNPRFIRQGPQHGRFMIANACMHCLDPVCMIGCPTGAIGRDAEAGAVTINDRTCIGCGTCASSCPYSNIRLVEIRDEQGGRILDRQTQLPIVKATKCDLCVENLGGPACQRACPHDALVRIDISDVETLSKWVTR